MRACDRMEGFLQRVPLQMSELPWADVVAQRLAGTGLLQLIIKLHESEELEGLLQFQKQRCIHITERLQRRQTVHRIAMLHSRIEGEQARRIYDGRCSERLEIELLLVLPAALEDERPKETQRRLYRDRDAS